jgi:hypothetical protein
MGPVGQRVRFSQLAQHLKVGLIDEFGFGIEVLIL